jgi:hypothetical protein
MAIKKEMARDFFLMPTLDSRVCQTKLHFAGKRRGWPFLKPRKPMILWRDCLSSLQFLVIGSYTASIYISKISVYLD